MKIQLLGEHLGAEVTGVDARTADAAGARALMRALAEHGVLCLRDQRLEPADLVAFARHFGEIEFAVREQFWLEEQPEVYVISNVLKDGKPIGNPNDGFRWHTDQSVMERPTAYTFLYGLETPPEGGDTEFCSTYRLYEELPEATRRRYADITLHISHARMHATRPGSVPLTEEQKERTPDVFHPLVRTHPLNGRKSLYFSRKTFTQPIGMSEAEGGALLDDLLARATQPEFTYAHKWRPRDLVIWDNRGALHRATEYDRQRYRRIMHRVSVRGEKPC